MAADPLSRVLSALADPTRRDMVARLAVASDPTVPLVRITREFDAPPEKVFRAHTDPELIVRTFTFEGFPAGVALERLVLTDLDDGRTLLTATSLVDSFEARDAFVASGMEGGVREGYERLDELLAS